MFLSIPRPCIVAVLTAAVLVSAIAIRTGDARAAAGVSRFDTQFLTSGACGERVLLDVSIVTVTHVHVDGNGGLHFAIQFNARAAGTGLVSGERYVAHQNEHDILYDTVPGPPLNEGQITSTVSQRVVGPGGLVFVLTWHGHLTVNANGVVAANFVHASTECV